MLSRTAEYAVRATLWLAAHPDGPRTVQQIARGTAVPAGYLAKVLQALGRAGIVRAQPGPGGGFLLSRPAAELAMLEVVDAVDPIERIRSCPLSLHEHTDRLCPLHSRLDAAMAMIEDAFRSCTVADLLHESGGKHVLCDLMHEGERAAMVSGNGQDARSTTHNGQDACDVEPHGRDGPAATARIRPTQERTGP